jgi:hypothetical protein
MVILGQAMLDEIEKAQGDGENMVAWQFGALDALTKQLSGAVTAAATMVKGMTPTQQDFVRFRSRVHRQLEPAVLALLNAELVQLGSEEPVPWPSDESKSGHA